jgi:hypothetical protein
MLSHIALTEGQMARPDPRIVLVVFALALGVSACNTAPTPTGDFGDQSAMQAEAQKEFNSLKWPPGVQMRTFPPAGTDRFQNGYGISQIGDQWLCAWSGDWIDNRLTDEARAKQDLETLDGVQQIHGWKYWDDPGHTVILDAISKAKLGDASPMVALRKLWSC